MRLLRTVSLRRLRAHRLRTSLVATGIALGVAILCAFNLLRVSIGQSFRRGIDAVAGKAHLELSGGPGGLPESVLETVRGVPEVAHAAAVLESTVAVVGGREGDSIHVIGLDLLGEEFFFGGLLQDRAPVDDPLAFLNSTESALVSSAFARARGIREGETFRVSTPAGIRTLRIHALLPMERLAEAYGGDVAVMDIVAMQIAFGREGRFDRVQVALRDPLASHVATVHMRAALGADVRIEPPATRGARIERMLLGFQTGLTFSSGLALMVAMFLVYNAVSIAVAERRSEIGTMRALGATRRQVRRLFVAEAAVLGAIGGAGGTALGVWLARLLATTVGESVSSLYARVQIRHIEARPAVLAGSVAFGIVASAAAAYFPARAAANVAPAEAARRSPPRPETVPAHALALAGLCCFALAAALAAVPPVHGVPMGPLAAGLLILFGLAFGMPIVLRASAGIVARAAGRLIGLPGRLAAQNLARLPGRTAVSVSALGAAAAMVIAVGSFVESVRAAVTGWLDDEIRADLLVSASSPWLGMTNTPMEPGIVGELRALPGVVDLDPVRVVYAEVNGERTGIMSRDVATYERYGHLHYVEGGKADVLRDLPRGAAVVSENFARRRGVHAGDEIALETPRGVARVRVVAVVVDYTSDAGLVRLDHAAYVRLYDDPLVDAVGLYVAPGTGADRLAALKAEILARRGDRDLRVYRNRELRRIYHGIIDQNFKVLGSLQIVALIVAVLGVLNTLLASVLDRTREIGMLRAIGATRRQVRSAIVAEATLVGFGSSLLGVPAGLALGLLMTRVINAQTSGWRFPFVIAWPALAQATIGIAVVAALVGLHPARRAAALEPTAALRAE